jgi:ABC-type enterochelin transport system substrate-binding protein
MKFKDNEIDNSFSLEEFDFDNIKNKKPSLIKNNT